MTWELFSKDPVSTDGTMRYRPTHTQTHARPTDANAFIVSANDEVADRCGTVAKLEVMMVSNSLSAPCRVHKIKLTAANPCPAHRRMRATRRVTTAQ